MPYNSLFLDYLICALAESHRRVQSAQALVPESTRQQAWHLLSFAFKQVSNPQAQPAQNAELWRQASALLLALTPKMEQAGFREEWIAYLLAAHESSQIQGDLSMAAECELQIGQLYRLMSRFDDAQLWSTASVTHFAALGDNTDERRALNELAWLEQLQHQYTEATRHVERALALSNEDDIERGMSLRVQGMIANSQRKWQIAQVYHEQALSIFEQCNDQRRIAWSLQNLAVSLHEQFEFEKAIMLFTRATRILESLDDVYHNAIINMNLGRTYEGLRELKTGLLYYTKAAKIFYQMTDTLNIARVETNLGTCHNALGNYQAAEQAFLAAIASYDSLHDLAWRLNGVAGLGMTYVADRQYGKAIEILERALIEIDQIKEHPYYAVTLDYLRQYLAQAREGQG